MKGGEMSVPIEVTANEALGVLRVVVEPYLTRVSNVEKLRLKLMDAVLQLEGSHSGSFSFLVEEEELWLIDQMFQEDTKDVMGNSLIPLRRKVWQSMMEIHVEDRLQPPLFFVVAGEDKTYKEASDAS